MLIVSLIGIVVVRGPAPLWGWGMNIVRLAALIVALGIDTLMTAVSLGTTNPNRHTRLMLATAFSLAESLMPLVGLGFGFLAGRVMGPWAPLAGGLALLAVGAWFIFGNRDGDETTAVRLSGGRIILLALSISIDEVAAGFSMGLLGIPVVLTTILIALQAFLFTTAGLTVGARLQSLLGPWAGKIAGVVLGLLGLETLAHILVPLLG